MTVVKETVEESNGSTKVQCLKEVSSDFLFIRTHSLMTKKGRDPRDNLIKT